MLYFMLMMLTEVLWNVMVMLVYLFPFLVVNAIPCMNIEQTT